MRQLLGELCDVSSEIEDYYVSAESMLDSQSHASLPIRLTAITTACLDPGSIIRQ